MPIGGSTYRWVRISRGNPVRRTFTELGLIGLNFSIRILSYNRPLGGNVYFCTQGIVWLHEMNYCALGLRLLSTIPLVVRPVISVWGEQVGQFDLAGKFWIEFLVHREDRIRGIMGQKFPVLNKKDVSLYFWQSRLHTWKLYYSYLWTFASKRDLHNSFGCISLD
jgi:hypothetical protein